MLGENAYGKSGIRLVKLARRGERHEIRDLTVAVRFEGKFESAHADGDNSDVLPTDTMKNTVYALAKDHRLDAIEPFALDLAAHFLDNNPPVSRVEIAISERTWERLTVGAVANPHAFRRAGEERRLARIVRERGTTEAAARVEAGLSDLTILKSANSAFSGFLRDRYTTLRETEDRIFATAVTAWWRYREPDLSWGATREAVRRTLLETFAEHESASVQHTLHAMGEAVLEHHSEVEEVRLTLPNKHHLLVDLSPFGLENRNEIFVATEEPYGLIEATLRR
jgi:urate oxidase